MILAQYWTSATCPPPGRTRASLKKGYAEQESESDTCATCCPPRARALVSHDKKSAVTKRTSDLSVRVFISSTGLFCAVAAV